MNWLARLFDADAASRAAIGPGRLVLVVGPSGAGKDTLIDACARGPAATIAMSCFRAASITRPSSAAEDHDTVSERRSIRPLAAGAFALWWPAHGLKYGIPRSIDADIRAGRTVVCNVSRTVVARRVRATRSDGGAGHGAARDSRRPAGAARAAKRRRDRGSRRAASR